MKTKRQFKTSFLYRGKWWIAWSDDLPGALTQGRTLSEARENLKDAIAMMQEPLDVDAQASDNLPARRPA